jgi:hypothetical protein
MAPVTATELPKAAEPEPKSNTELTGVYGFVGIQGHGQGASAEALGIAGTHKEKGPFFGTLSGVGGGAEIDVVGANEALYYPRTREWERERIIIAETELFQVRKAESYGIGGFIDRADPREFGVFVYVSGGPVTAGGGFTGRVDKDFETEARETLAKQGITLVRAPEGTPKRPSPLSIKAKMESWLRLFGIGDAWLDRQIKEQNEVFAKSGNSTRLVRGNR